MIPFPRFCISHIYFDKKRMVAFVFLLWRTADFEPQGLAPSLRIFWSCPRFPAAFNSILSSLRSSTPLPTVLHSGTCTPILNKKVTILVQQFQVSSSDESAAMSRWLRIPRPTVGSTKISVHLTQILTAFSELPLPDEPSNRHRVDMSFDAI